MQYEPRHRTRLKACVVLVTLGASAAAIGVPIAGALANGFGENRPYQFRSANDRATLLNNERTRLEVEGDLGVGSSAGLGAVGSQNGAPTGNSVTIEGNNNTITQTNSAEQSTNNELKGGINAGGN